MSNCKHENCFEFCKNKHMGEEDIKFIELSSIKQQTDDEFLLKFNTNVHHDPGQFMQLSLFGIGEAPISFCSYNKNFFEMSVRNVGNVSAHLCNLKKGDKIGFRGPYGRGYNMELFENNNVVIVAGGSGVAPVRGIIQYILQNRDKYKEVNIFFGFRKENLVLFKDEFEEWNKNGITVDLVFSDEKKEGIKKGFVTDIIDCKATESNENKIVFVCGPPPMINAVCKKLLDKNFNKDQLYISEERHMKCAVGRCGHCMIEDKYCCTDGPVFRYDELEGKQG